MSVLGRWRNEYGSILDIQSQAPNGALSGVYTSDTGASGTYLMNGWCPFEAASTQNGPISVNIFWKPTDSSAEDPSWNWVSNMTGALFYDAPTGVPRLQLLHGMVASTLFPAVQVDRPGVYTETLGFDLLPDLQNRGRAPTSCGVAAPIRPRPTRSPISILPRGSPESACLPKMMGRQLARFFCRASRRRHRDSWTPRPQATCNPSRPPA